MSKGKGIGSAVGSGQRAGLAAIAIFWSLVFTADLPAPPGDPPPPDVPAGGIVGEIAAATAICGYVYRRARRGK